MSAFSKGVRSLEETIQKNKRSNSDLKSVGSCEWSKGNFLACIEGNEAGSFSIYN